MVHGETMTRSLFDADDVISRLRARGVEQLRGESGIWVILDGSDIRKPYAQAWEEARLLRRLGGEERENRPPGKIVLTRGLRRLMDVCVTEAILAAHIAEYGALPPQIAAILGRPVMG